MAVNMDIIAESTAIPNLVAALQVYINNNKTHNINNNKTHNIHKQQ
jgi:hypothetical protein